MTNEILEHFRLLDTPVLLHAAAFELPEYSLEAQGFLRSALLERGVDETQIRAYRLKMFPFPTMDVDCEKCGEKLTIERQELNEGTLTCPECGTTQLVPYPEIALDQEDYSMTGRKLPEIVLSRRDRDGQDSIELVNDPLAPVLGQGTGVSRIGAGDGGLVEEVRLLEEGLPDTVCAKCAVVLDPEHTFLVDEDFFCETCFSKLVPSELEGGEEDDNS